MWAFRFQSWDRAAFLKKLLKTKTIVMSWRVLLSHAGLKNHRAINTLTRPTGGGAPAYNENVRCLHLNRFMFGEPKERTAWAVDQLKYAAKTSKNLGLNAHATFSGALMWHTVYPCRNARLVWLKMDSKLAKRWTPILNALIKWVLTSLRDSSREDLSMALPSSVLGGNRQTFAL